MEKCCSAEEELDGITEELDCSTEEEKSTELDALVCLVVRREEEEPPNKPDFNNETYRKLPKPAPAGAY